MKINNIELTREQAILLSAGVIILIVLVLDAIFYMPLMRKLTNKYIECKECENTVFDARNLIEGAGKNCGSMILLTEKDVSLAIEELTNLGKSKGISFVSIKPMEVTLDKDLNYKILPIEMDIEGGDKQFSDFLGSLDDMKKTLIKVKSFDIVPNRDDRTSLKAHITIHIYLSAKEYSE